ncbi:DMT family transporter [Ornithinimicrobium faecis]|uniref:DMT family transporter n=1 Tax=Ornithinimicrobium faecis TaxID=2934158 RepID=A0ABY4YTI5_9MICO|nr:DMT family transporter [Ornithinimicrobium sp. HY1793]USQ79467.1 DMT family transporter [Ornithinimicrobium sp. HY1793]
MPHTLPSRHRHGRLVAVLALLGATVCWAGNYLVGAAAVQSITPLDLVLLRWLVALPLLVLLAQRLERPAWREVLSQWRWLVALSLTGLLGYPLLVYVALEHTTALSASLVNATNPALIVLVAALTLRERLRPLTLLGVIIAMAGALVVLSRGDLGVLAGARFGAGELVMLGAVVAWTAYTIIGRAGQGRLRVPPVTAVAVQAAITVVVVAPVSLATGGPSLPMTPQAAGAVLFIAVFPSVLAYLLWSRALSDLPAGSAGVFLNLITVFVAAFTLLAGQPYSLAQLVGGLIVIVGVIVTNVPVLRRGRASVS